MTTMPLSYLKSILDQTKLDEITYESEMEKDEKEGEENVECNTTGKDTLTQNQNTGKKSRKSTKKTTTTKK